MNQNSNQQHQTINQKFTKDDAYQTLNMINAWINNIDTKDSFALAFVGVLVASIFSDGFPSAIRKMCQITKIAELSGCEVIAILLICALYIVSFISILCFLLVIIARIKNLNSNQSVFFFGSISSMNLNDYKEKLQNIDDQSIIKDLEEQIHINSLICSKKAKYYNIGIKFLAQTVVLWFICKTFRLI